MIAAMDACLDTLGDIPLIEDALATAREHHNQVLERMVLINLSELVLTSPDAEVLTRGLGWSREGYRVAMQLGDPGSAAMGLGNAGAAALLSGASVDRAMVDLHQSSELARRASDIVIRVETSYGSAQSRPHGGTPAWPTNCSDTGAR